MFSFDMQVLLALMVANSAGELNVLVLIIANGTQVLFLKKLELARIYWIQDNQ